MKEMLMFLHHRKGQNQNKFLVLVKNYVLDFYVKSVYLHLGEQAELLMTFLPTPGHQDLPVCLLRFLVRVSYIYR